MSIRAKQNLLLRICLVTVIATLLAWYLVAKLCKVYDREIYQLLVLISGHSLKHIAAGIAGLVFLRHLRYRVRLPQ